MRRLILIVTIAACATDETQTGDPHELTTCGSSWDARFGHLDQCERACVDMHTGGSCPATYVGGLVGDPSTTSCNGTSFRFGMVAGCCDVRIIMGGAQREAAFFVCDGQ